MADTIPMTHIDTGKTANVHPNEVANWKSHGWRLSESVPVPLPPPPPVPEKLADKPKLSLPNKKG